MVAIITGSRQEISASTHDSNKVSTAIPRFSASVKRLDYSVNINHVLHCGPFIVLAYKFTHPPLNGPRRRCIGGTLGLSMLHNVSHSGTRTSPAVLPDPKTWI